MKKVFVDSLFRINKSKKLILVSLIRISYSEEVFLDSLIRNNCQKNTFLSSLFETETGKMIQVFRTKCFFANLSFETSGISVEVRGVRPETKLRKNVSASNTFAQGLT